jgi:hypothetical protein
LPLSLAIQQNPNVGKVWLLTKNHVKTSGQAVSLPIDAHGTLRERKVALFKNRIKQNQVMEYHLIKLYQLNQA